jgi:hypothetical protein
VASGSTLRPKSPGLKGSTSLYFIFPIQALTSSPGGLLPILAIATGSEFAIMAFCASGEVAEWLNAADSKSALGSHLTEVRILSSPYLDNRPYPGSAYLVMPLTM